MTALLCGFIKKVSCYLCFLVLLVQALRSKNFKSAVPLWSVAKSGAETSGARSFAYEENRSYTVAVFISKDTQRPLCGFFVTL